VIFTMMENYKSDRLLGQVVQKYQDISVDLLIRHRRVPTPSDHVTLVREIAL